MPYVWMDEVPKVQTVGADGIGVYPPVPVEAVEKIGGDGRGMYEVKAPANEIPNPGAVNLGAAIVQSNGSWSSGAAGSGSGSSGSSNVMIVNVDGDTGALDKTWQEIYDAVDSGKIIFMPSLNGNLSVNSFYIDHDERFIYTSLAISVDGDGPYLLGYTFKCSTANDYPVFDESSSDRMPIGGSMVVHLTPQLINSEPGYIADKTAAEIVSAASTRLVVYVSFNGILFHFGFAEVSNEGEYAFNFCPALLQTGNGQFAIASFVLYADTEDDYPKVTQSQITMTPIGSGSGSGDSDLLVVRIIEDDDDDTGIYVPPEMGEQ